jgi:hydrophobic/amphiphilic exporter-1 (mainly G- bacteria), HAE1 family
MRSGSGWIRISNITTTEIENALLSQNTVNPSGQIGGEPIPPGQPFTNTVLAQGRLVTAEQFGNVVIRAEPNGAYVRVKDVGRVELGSQSYTQTSTLNGKPSAVLAVYQLPGSNAVDAAKGVRQLMEQLKARFPSGLDYSISLDATLAVTAGMEEIYKTLVEAMILVHRRFHFPPGLARYADSAVRRPGIAGQHVCIVSAAGVLGQYTIIAGTGSGHWLGGR